MDRGTGSLISAIYSNVSKSLFVLEEQFALKDER
jgi:hypothetical protein